MTNEHDDEMKVKQNSASSASRPDSAVRARAEKPDMLGQEELEARHGGIGRKRRQAGPVEDVSYPDETESTAAGDAPETRLAEPPKEVG